MGGGGRGGGGEGERGGEEGCGGGRGGREEGRRGAGVDRASVCGEWDRVGSLLIGAGEWEVVRVWIGGGCGTGGGGIVR